MSESILRAEIKKVIRTSSLSVDYKMLCPIVKLLNMKYENIDNKQALALTKEIITLEIQ